MAAPAQQRILPSLSEDFEAWHVSGSYHRNELVEISLLKGLLSGGERRTQEEHARASFESIAHGNGCQAGSLELHHDLFAALAYLSHQATYHQKQKIRGISEFITDAAKETGLLTLTTPIYAPGLGMDDVIHNPGLCPYTTGARVMLRNREYLFGAEQSPVLEALFGDRSYERVKSAFETVAATGRFELDIPRERFPEQEACAVSLRLRLGRLTVDAGEPMEFPLPALAFRIRPYQRRQEGTARLNYRKAMHYNKSTRP